MTPNTAVTTTVITVMISVSWNACRTSARLNVSFTVDQPGLSAVHTMPTSGSSNSAAR